MRRQLAAYAIPIPIKSVPIRAYDTETPGPNITTVNIGSADGDAERRVGRIAVGGDRRGERGADPLRTDRFPYRPGHRQDGQEPDEPAHQR